ncbi:thiamine pyrophosphate-dependent enzyme [Rhodospirillum sp. A1_3_36]|uniref:alpha-ketoacid dehydrogenase subunit alpha/beta n=1 Tax=Rhodospirillum sp. A1_3_36 TaxID=3391666 RepID=UPI0039A69ABB
MQNTRLALDSSSEELFRAALMIRRVEERICDIYASDRIQSPVHLSIGQEAVAVGVCACLTPEDWLFSSYRSHAYYLAKGGDLKRMFAELCGKVDGDAKGKAGSMHLTAPEVGLMGSSAVVASTLPHAVGAAFGFRRQAKGAIVVVTFGDGATDEGVFHESMNAAALYKVPLLFLCEDNGLAVHSEKGARQSYDIPTLASQYGMPVTVIEDGHDVEVVRAKVAAEVARLRAGEGPRFVLVKTYRYKEHVGPGDDFDAGYRGREAFDRWRALDPLLTDGDTRNRLLPGVEADIDAALAFAEESPWPGPEELCSDVDRPDFTYGPPLTWAPGKAEAMTYREALFRSMDGALRDHSGAFIMGQGVDDHKGIFGTTTGLPETYGAERCFDTPIAEEGVAGMALGASLTGLYPIQTHIRADFMLLATNQIINLAAKYRYMFGGRFEVPLLIRSVIGRSWGQGAQHSQSLQSLFAHIPGLCVLMPADSQSILDSYEYAVRHYRGPVIAFEHRLLYDLAFQTGPALEQRHPFGARLLRRGKDVTIVATSIMVLEARRAADHLAGQGIDCEIIDLNCVSHPDGGMVLDSLRKTGKLLVADTSWLPYGVCAEVCRLVCETAPELLRAPVKTLGMAPAPCPTAKALEDLYYPNLTTLCDALATLVMGQEKHGIPLPEERSMADIYKRFKGPF